MKNGIYLVATPIGNIADITLRAIETLKTADIIACEDTRVTKKLFSLLGISTGSKKFIPMHDHNENDVAQNLINLASEGAVVAYVSDAGSPLISDPGFKLAQRCRDQNIYLTTIPGACAAISALQLSGLPTNTFTFAGFIPNKDKARQETFSKYASFDTTLIFYETANRLTRTLSVASHIFKNRQISVIREITKLHEECQTGTPEVLLNHFTENPPKGEIVLVIAPNNEESQQIDFIPELKKEMQTSSLKTAVKTIVEKFGANNNDVYQTALGIKNGQ